MCANPELVNDMKIGLLQCDDVAEPLRARHGNYPDMVQAMLDAVDRRLQFQTWRCHEGQIPAADAGVDGWIMTGSKCSANDAAPWIQELSHFVRQLWNEQQPLVGICFGHQLIAHALGGRVDKSPNGWGVGVMIHDLKKRQPWMTPWHGRTVQLLASHQDQVMQIPEDAVVLAGSDFCPNYMMQIGDVFLGVQGHPEFTRGYAADLMEMRRDVIPEKWIEAGLRSLKLHADDMAVARWILNFMQRNRVR